MKNIIQLCIGILLFATILHAKQSLKTEDLPQVGVDVPKDPSGVPLGIQRNRLEANTIENQALYKEMQIKRTQREMILSEIFDPDILMQPITRVIRAIDSIGVTPEYITTILFPSNMEIKDAKSSFNAPLFEFNRNLLRFRPDAKSFFAGNMVITLSDGTKNYEMSIHVSRYYQRDCTIEKDQYVCWKMHKEWKKNKSTKAYPYAYNNLSLYYTYKNAKILDNMDVISIYEKLKGQVLNLQRNGDFDVIQYDGVSYRIIRDDTFGDIHYRAHIYRIKIGS